MLESEPRNSTDIKLIDLCALMHHGENQSVSFTEKSGIFVAPEMPTFSKSLFMCFIGIDSRVRRRFKGQYLMPSIGYGTKASDRHRCSVRRLVLLRNTVLYVLLLTLYRNTVFQIRSKLEIILGPKKLQKICCQQCC